MPAPFMALTASAPPRVEADVKAILDLSNCVMVTLPLDRPNIYIATRKKSSLSVSWFSYVDSVLKLSLTIILYIYVHTYSVISVELLPA